MIVRQKGKVAVVNLLMEQSGKMFPMPKELPELNDLCEYCRHHPQYCGTTINECELLLGNEGYSEAKFQLKKVWE